MEGIVAAAVSGLEAVQPEASAVKAASVATFAKRKNRGGQNMRTKKVEEEDGEDEQTEVFRKAKQVRPNTFTTKTDRNEDLSGVQYASNQGLQTSRDSLATAMMETETQVDRDARALREKVMSQAGIDGEIVADGTYKGMTGYVDYRKGFRREHNVGSEKGTGSHGPLRASMYARVSTRFDYQPDICKDYKETGFCSYGDACKFLHDRGDYKSGWELERDWNEEQKLLLEEKMKGWNPDEEAGGPGGPGEGEAGDEDADGDGLPFACFTCRRTWDECKSAVVTRCKHYFCEKCALKNNKTGKCAVCNQATQGIFNVAQDIAKKMKQLTRDREAKA